MPSRGKIVAENFKPIRKSGSAVLPYKHAIIFRALPLAPLTALSFPDGVGLSTEKNSTEKFAYAFGLLGQIYAKATICWDTVSAGLLTFPSRKRYSVNYKSERIVTRN